MAYLNGDKNFPSVYAAGNTGNAFIDKSSLNVQLYNPPYYRIAAIIVSLLLSCIRRWTVMKYIDGILLCTNIDGIMTIGEACSIILLMGETTILIGNILVWQD